MICCTGSTLQEGQEGGVRDGHPQECVWQDTQEGSYQARDVQAVKCRRLSRSVLSSEVSIDSSLDLHHCTITIIFSFALRPNSPLSICN